MIPIECTISFCFLSSRSRYRGGSGSGFGSPFFFSSGSGSKRPRNMRLSIRLRLQLLSCLQKGVQVIIGIKLNITYLSSVTMLIHIIFNRKGLVIVYKSCSKRLILSLLLFLKLFLCKKKVLSVNREVQPHLLLVVVSRPCLNKCMYDFKQP